MSEIVAEVIAPVLLLVLFALAIIAEVWWLVRNGWAPRRLAVMLPPFVYLLLKNSSKWM